MPLPMQWAVLAGLALASADALPEPLPEKVVPSRLWEGSGPVWLRCQAPEAGLIGDARAFARLWSAWRPGERPPFIDFEREVVIVVSAAGEALGPGALTIEPKLDERGRLRFDVTETVLDARALQGEGGFVYALAAFRRAEVGMPTGATRASFRRQQKPVPLFT